MGCLCLDSRSSPQQQRWQPYREAFAKDSVHPTAKTNHFFGLAFVAVLMESFIKYPYEAQRDENSAISANFFAARICFFSSCFENMWNKSRVKTKSLGGLQAEYLRRHNFTRENP